MSKMSLEEALAEVLDEMDALSADELRADLKKHSNGAFAVAMREASEFFASFGVSHSTYIALFREHMAMQDNLDFENVLRSSVQLFEEVALSAANDNSYALAA
ncbi:MULTISPECIES: hypothetical protein [Janthinobacterium]|uniref:Uncharacterized protein n=1 Tax=Janthinobacterium violaceinigrum TaxID=2654252 RepID=A0A6I1I0Y3_9BURK|nr:MULTISPECIES: hypothetical protein [Janthinobacterium]KAB8063209.1 hypothetical protein GCN75_19775 [Janthinobacterium violaceinigrum]MED5617163.1 hypothetical protein [Janthinobacterium sp. P210005]